LAGKPTQRTNIRFTSGFASVCLKVCIIVLTCIIFSFFQIMNDIIYAELYDRLRRALQLAHS